MKTLLVLCFAFGAVPAFSQISFTARIAAKQHLKTQSFISRPGRSRTYYFNSNQQWTYSYTNTFTYTSFSDLNSNTQTDSTNTVNPNQNREFHYYDIKRRDTLIVYQQWNTNTGTWDNSYKQTYSYDVHDAQTSFTYYSWDNVMQQWNINFGSRSTITYDNANNPVSNLTQSYNSTTFQWDNLFLISDMYVSNILIEEITQKWNGNAWVNEDRYYDVTWYNYPDFKPLQFYHDTWDGSNWTKFERISYTYNNLDFVALRDTIQNNTWSNNARATHTADYYGSYTDIEEQMSPGGWQFTSKYITEYDTHYNNTLNESYSYTNAWILNNGMKNIHSYSGTDLLETIRQFYDLNQFQYVNSQKIIYSNFQHFDNTSLLNLSEGNVLIFPNPASSGINLLSEETIINIKIYDATGNIVRMEHPRNQSVYLDLSRLNSGIYFYLIENNSGNIKGKFVKD